MGRTTTISIAALLAGLIHEEVVGKMMGRDEAVGLA